MLAGNTYARLHSNFNRHTHPGSNAHTHPDSNTHTHPDSSAHTHVDPNVRSNTQPHSYANASCCAHTHDGGAEWDAGTLHGLSVGRNAPRFRNGVFAQRSGYAVGPLRR